MAPKTYHIQQLLEKMLSPDQDFRFMALNDLMAEVATEKTQLFHQDEATEVKVLSQVLSLIEDKISEVKNQAVKCLGQLIKIIKEANLNLVVNKLIEFSSSKEEELRDVAGLALKTIVSELPADGKLAQSACSKLVPKLLEQLMNPSTPPETIIETLSTLSVLVTRFPQHTSAVNEDYIGGIAPLLGHSRPAVRKRAITTLAQFIPNVPLTKSIAFITSTVIPALAPSTSLDKQRTFVQVVGAIVRYAPPSSEFEACLRDMIAGVLADAKRDDSELREGCLQTLETLVLRCPSEITPSLPAVLAIATELVKYDPNYTTEGDDDEEMDDADEDDDDDDDEVDDAYSDDEDTSYKVRRSSVKLIGAVVDTRPEMLGPVYKTVSPVLISRFGDREASVKLEIWSTYGLLIKQTGVYGGAPQSSNTEGLKMDVEDTPYALLKSQVPSLAKALLKQLQPKSPTPTLLAGFNLLQGLLQVVPGSLSDQAEAVASISASVLSSPTNTSTATLHSTVLSFLALFFATHAPSTFQSSLPRLTPRILAAASQRHPRVAAEALRASSALLSALKPVQSGDWVNTLYDEVVSKLKSNDTDTEVRKCAEDVVTELWLSATDVVKSKGGAEWDALMRGGRTEGAVQVIAKVSAEVNMPDAWVASSTEWIMGLLKKPGKSGKAGVFTCLEVLLRNYQSGIPQDIPDTLVPQLQGLLSLNDLVLLTHALTTLSILLTLAPRETFPLVEASLLKPIYEIAYSPLVSGAALEALTEFFCTLVQADGEISGHVVPGLVTALEKNAGADTSPANVSKCISAVVKGASSIAAGVIAEFAKAIKPGHKSKELHVVLSLLALGEIGKTIDMSRQPDVFANTLVFFTAETESVRSAAAFAAGNIAVGNIQHFFPILLAQVQTDSDKQLLTLHAMKEVVSNCPRGHLENVASALWQPLFEISSSGEETTRNVAAACLGQLATANPSQYLPELQGRLTDPSASVRGTVVAAIRYTLADSSRTYDELLAPLILQFVPLIQDQDLGVRRSALATLNAAARNKPHLLREQLPTLMPLIYAQTKQNPDLIRIVEMGPWKHKVDDGLEARKTTFETLYTILDTCLDKIDIHELLAHVLRGLKDEANEIKVLCHMMLFRLAQVAPTAVAQRLDEAAPQLAEGMKAHTVEKNTVKQDIERTAELQRSTLRAIAALSKISTPGTAPAFDKVVESVSKSGSTFASEFRELL